MKFKIMSIHCRNSVIPEFHPWPDLFAEQVPRPAAAWTGILYIHVTDQDSFLQGFQKLFYYSLGTEFQEVTSSKQRQQELLPSLTARVLSLGFAWEKKRPNSCKSFFDLHMCRALQHEPTHMQTKCIRVQIHGHKTVHIW